MEFLAGGKGGSKRVWMVGGSPTYRQRSSNLEARVARRWKGEGVMSDEYVAPILAIVPFHFNVKEYFTCVCTYE